MSFYTFGPDDIINTYILAYPSYNVSLNGDQMTGSVYLEKQYLTSSLFARRFQGWSDKEGGFVEANGPFTASIDIWDAEEGATNKQLYRSILNLYDYYSIINTDYTPQVTGSDTTRFRVVIIPEIYTDKEILSGSITLSDLDKDGNERILHDNGRGGIYSGSLSGTLVGNVFYSEGLVVLKAGGLNDEANANDFGEVSPTNHKWTISFKGTHKIPVKIFRCRASAGELNASTNTSFYQILTGTDANYRNEKEAVVDFTYVTEIGLYNDDYLLVGMIKLGQPVKKEVGQNILFRARLDF